MMTLKAKIKFLIFLFVAISQYATAQIGEYASKRDIVGVTAQWNSIELPDDAFALLKPNMADIRIYGINNANDTIEVPYILKITDSKSECKTIHAKIINKTYSYVIINGETTTSYHYTFDNNADEVVNEINLKFGLQNFDWNISLEGSHDQKQWYTVLDNYRILSIKNDLADFSFTTLRFPDAKYRYFKLNINTATEPELTSASLYRKEFTEGKYKQYNPEKIEIIQNKDKKQTVILARLADKVPVCEIKLHVSDSFDYYRPMTIRYVSDSVKINKGWQYNYRFAGNTILNSVDKNRAVNFADESVISNIMEITINNQDNKPLTVDSLSILGNVYELIARFDDTEATYALYYGNTAATKPSYDIAHFQDKIPEELHKPALGNKITLEVKKKDEQKPLIENKLWLWCLIILIIITLGWFSLKMLNSKENNQDT